MKIRNFFLALFFFISLLSSAQHAQPYYPYSLQKGDFLISAGISLAHFKTVNYANSSRTGVFPEISLTGEYAIADELSIGPIVSYYARRYKYDTPAETFIFEANRYFVGGRASFHFAPFLEKHLVTNLDSEHFDIYMVFGAGYKGTFFVNDPYNRANGRMSAIAMAGLRYMFFENIGLYAEGGLGPFAAFTFGLTVRL